MAECYANEHEIQDKRLNIAYKNVMKNSSKQRKDDLREIQRAWIKYRDLKCMFEGDLTGGTMDIILANSCHLRMTVERAKELEYLAQHINDFED